MLIENTHHKLSWRCICNINSLKSVFSENNISLPYIADELKNLDFKIKYNKANKTIHVALIVPIPNGIDLVTNTILYNEKKLFEFDITKNKFMEKQFVNFKTIDDSDDEYLFLDEPIEEHEIISLYKNNFIEKIISSNFFPKITSMLKLNYCKEEGISKLKDIRQNTERNIGFRTDLK